MTVKSEWGSYTLRKVFHHCKTSHANVPISTPEGVTVFFLHLPFIEQRFDSLMRHKDNLKKGMGLSKMNGEFEAAMELAKQIAIEDKSLGRKIVSPFY